ncbi:hypothetical protein BH20VER2_BH20VER2_18490 [soil metagenome]
MRARSDLEIPQPAPKLLALYLPLAIGFKGGVELHKSGLDGFHETLCGCSATAARKESPDFCRSKSSASSEFNVKEARFRVSLL